MQRSADNRFSFSTGFLIFLALILCIVPPAWILAFVLSAIFHEAGHYGAVILCGGKIQWVSIKTGSVCMRCDNMKNWQKLLCVLAGPAGGSIPVLWIHAAPEIGLSALVLTCYNLLPLPGLDGGNAAACIANMLFTEKTSHSVVKTIHIFTSVLVLFVGMAGTVSGFGPVPAVMCGLVLVKSWGVKNHLQIFRFKGTIKRHMKKRYCYDRTASKNPAHCAETGTVYRRRIQ